MKKILKKSTNKKRVIVFGSNGFIASSVIRELKKNKISFKSISKKYYDLTKTTNSKKISSIIKNNDTILFISAIAPSKDILSFNKNLLMASTFLDAVKNKKINHFIYVSSDAVYSDSKKNLTERSKTFPDNLHGLMHITREILFLRMIKNITIVRPTLIYGQNDPHNGYGPNSFYRLANLNKEIKIFGKGEELRDHVHINDVAMTILAIIRKRKFGIFNICSGHLISFRKIAEKILKETNSNSKINFIKRSGPMPHNGYRPLSNNLIKKTIRIKYLTFDQGLKKYNE